MVTSKIRILHISDLHVRGPRETASFRRQRVLGDAWTRNIKELLEEGAFDLVCFTGDIAQGGKADEYGSAADFLEGLLRLLNLPLDRLFLVPGNHDVDRMEGTPSEAAWQQLRNHLFEVDAKRLSDWMEGNGAPLGFTAGHREQILFRQAAYRQWVGTTLGRREITPQSSLHPNLGYRQTLRLPDRKFDVHIIGLDSAWASGDGNDAGHLLLTDAQVGRLTTTKDGFSLPGFRLALVHHPLAALADASIVRPLIADGIDLLLRGHLHEPRLETILDPDRALRQLAAGCLYDGDEADRWRNAFHVVEAVLDEAGRPLRYNVRFRGWSPAGHWFDDGGIYEKAHHGRATLEVLPRSC